MLKIRLMGTKNDIKWFEKILEKQPKVVLTEFSDLYNIQGTDRYYRVYAEVQKANIEKKPGSNLNLRQGHKRKQEK